MILVLLPLACVNTADDSARPFPDVGDAPAEQEEEEEEVEVPGGDGGGGEADTEGTDDAAVVSTSFPASLECGGSDLALVTMRNTGTSTWTAAAGYKLGTVGDWDDLYTSDTRVLMGDGDSISPGEDITFALTLSGPATASTYQTDWQMVHESVAWFGEATAASVEVACESETEPTGTWVCGDVGARNGDEVCDDAGMDVSDTSTRWAIYCMSATGGVGYASSNTGPACSDGVHRCQGWEESGQNAWDYLDYIGKLTCTFDGEVLEIDLAPYLGSTVYFGAHDQPDGSGSMTWACAASWQE